MCIRRWLLVVYVELERWLAIQVVLCFGGRFLVRRLKNPVLEVETFALCYLLKGSGNVSFFQHACPSHSLAGLHYLRLFTHYIFRLDDILIRPDLEYLMIQFSIESERGTRLAFTLTLGCLEIL